MTDFPPPEARPAGAPLTLAEDKQWASFAHLGGIVGFLPSLIIWLVFKDRGVLVNVEGREALNFQITVAIGYAVCVVLSIIPFVGLITFLLFPAIWVVSIVFSILGFVAVNNGRPYRYPINLRLIK